MCRGAAHTSKAESPTQPSPRIVPASRVLPACSPSIVSTKRTEQFHEETLVLGFKRCCALTKGAWQPPGLELQILQLSGATQVGPSPVCSSAWKWPSQQAGVKLKFYISIQRKGMKDSL